MVVVSIINGFGRGIDEELPTAGAYDRAFGLRGLHFLKWPSFLCRGVQFAKVLPARPGGKCCAVDAARVVSGDADNHAELPVGLSVASSEWLNLLCIEMANDVDGPTVNPRWVSVVDFEVAVKYRDRLANEADSPVWYPRSANIGCLWSPEGTEVDFERPDL